MLVCAYFFAEFYCDCGLLHVHFETLIDNSHAVLSANCFRRELVGPPIANVISFITFR